MVLSKLLIDSVDSCGLSEALWRLQGALGHWKASNTQEVRQERASTGRVGGGASNEHRVAARVVS